MANGGGIEDAIRHVYPAKRWLLIGYTERSRSKRRQALVREYFM